MVEISGDIWERHADGEVVAITTGGAVDKHGACLMPRGCAAQARERFPGIEKVLGGLISRYGNHVYDIGNRVISFPVENSPFENPDTRIIKRSCHELVELCERNGWNRVVVPRPGCGGGGLEWHEVRSILDRYFDDRFQVISQEVV